MSKQLFINLPVKDVDKAKAFFTGIGFKFNEQFGAVVINDTAYVMLMTEEFLSSFSKKAITDTAKSSEFAIAVAVESKEEVDQIVDKALAAGAKPAGEPNGDPSMHNRGFYDLDGHQWEVVYMDFGGPA